MIFDEDSEVKINIFKWKGEDKVDIEIHYGGFDPLDISTSTMKEADIFIKLLKKAVVTKYKLNEDGMLI